MKYTLDKNEKYTIVNVQEEKLNNMVSPELKSLFVLLNSENVRNIILNLGEVSVCDSSGLSSILIGNRLCREVKGSFVLTGLKDTVKKLILISQLNNVLSITPTVNEAIDTVFMEELERELNGDN